MTEEIELVKGKIINIPRKKPNMIRRLWMKLTRQQILDESFVIKPSELEGLFNLEGVTSEGKK